MNLFIEPAEGAPFRRSFDGGSMVIGRASSADLMIQDPFLSRHHARLFEHEGRTWIEDLESRNGTQLNGESVESPRPLEPGDRIHLSSSTVHVGSVDSSTVDLQATLLRPAIEFLRNAERETQASQIDDDRLRDHAHRLHRLNDIYKEMGRTLSLTDLSSVLLDRAFEELRPDHAALFLLQEDGSYQPTAVRARDDAAPAPPLSRSLVREVCHKGMSALVNDASQDQRFSDSQSLMLSGSRSLAAAPLLDEHGSLGMVVLSSASIVREFSEDDLEFLTSVASVAALKIRNLRLARAALARQSHQQELKIARRIQESLLPQALPTFPGLDIFARNTPSQGVSGDFYEFQQLDDGNRCMLMIVDVSGKGIPAALLTASIEALAAGPMEEERDAADVLATVSRRLYDRTPPEKYATAFLASVDGVSGEISFANAGHVPAIVLGADGAHRTLESAGRPLGLVAGSSYELGHAVLAPGETLIAYTDGVTEAENDRGEQYGLERLVAVASREAGRSAEAIGEAILSDLQRFTGERPPGDDCTLLLARRLPDR